MILTYYCKSCNKNQFHYVPVCRIDKETTECKYCNRRIRLSPDFLDSLTNKTLELKEGAGELHKDLVEVHETLREMIKVLKQRGNINVQE